MSTLMRKRKMAQANRASKRQRSTLSRRVATLERTRPRQQLKYVDVDITNNISGVIPLKLTDVTQGSDRVNRIGNHILIKKIDINWVNTTTAGSGVSTYTSVELFKSRDTDDLLSRADTFGTFPDPEKYTVIRKMSDNGESRGQPYQNHRMSVPMNFGIQYDGSAANSQIGKDLGVYLQNKTGASSSITGTFRVWFIDA